MIAVFGYIDPTSAVTIIVDAADREKFAQMVQRACNVWPDAPPEIKEFADRITVGKVLQNYYIENVDQRKKSNTDKIYPPNLTDLTDLIVNEKG